MDSQENRQENVKTPRFTTRTAEKYQTTKLGGHYLILEQYIKDTETGEEILFSEYKHKLPKAVPKYLTELDLWHHTEFELDQLRGIMRHNKERKPSKKTLKQWKDVLSTNNANQQA